MTTDIVIVSYKDEDPIKKCLASVRDMCTDFKLIIEDNNGEGLNRGFTRAVNDGILKGSSEYVWLLNSDCIVLEGAQQGLINMFSQGSQVGIVGSMQLDYKNMDFISCGGVFSSPFPAGRHRSGLISMGHWQIPEKQTWQNFASVMLRRSMIEKIGLLDTSMYLIYSDSSYCYTARERGYECWYAPKSRVLHRLNASKTVTEWHQKDMIAFMKKWGITSPGDGTFQVSERFHRLDLFP